MIIVEENNVDIEFQVKKTMRKKETQKESKKKPITQSH